MVTGSAGGGADARSAPLSPAEAASVQLLELMRAFVSRIWIFLGVIAIVVAASVYHTTQATRIYRATAQVLIERQAQQVRGIDDPVQIDTQDIDYYNTQFTILRSTGLAERVVVALNLQDRPEFGESAADIVAAGILLEYTKNNRVVEVSFEHPDPNLAAQIIAKLVETYETASIERRKKTINTLGEEMGKEVVDVKKDMEESERALTRFYEEHALLLMEEHNNGYQKVVEEMSVQLARDEAELVRLEVLAAQVEACGNDVAKLAGLRAVTESAAVYYMRMEEQRAHEEVEAARQKYQKSHPSLAAAEARANESSAKIEREIRFLAGGILLQREAKRETVKKGRLTYESLRTNQTAKDGLIMRADSLRRVRDSKRTLHETLLQRIKETKISSNIETTNVHVLAPARPTKDPVRPNLLKNLMMGLLIGIFMGGAATMLLEKLDNRVRTPEDVEIPFGIPVLAVVPERRPESSAGPVALTCWQDDRSQVAESFRQLRAGVLLAMRDDKDGGGLRTILVTSPGPGEGKTCSAVNLAITLAQTGAKTLFIDMDFHRSDAHKLFGLDRDKGLSTILTSDIQLAQAVQPTTVPFLDFMATGMVPPQPASLLGSGRMKWVLEEAARFYSRIVIDSPPMMAVTDATMVAPQMDAVILVVRQGKTLKTAVRRVMQTLARIGVKPLGMVFNGVTARLGDFYFKYHHPSYTMEEEPVHRAQ